MLVLRQGLMYMMGQQQGLECILVDLECDAFHLGPQASWCTCLEVWQFRERIERSLAPDQTGRGI